MISDKLNICKGNLIDLCDGIEEVKNLVAKCKGESQQFDKDLEDATQLLSKALGIVEDLERRGKLMDAELPYYLTRRNRA